LFMDGREFIQYVRRVGKERGVSFRFEPRHGKGSHGRLWYGNKFTTVKDRRKEIGKGLLSAMLKQLDLELDDLKD